MIRATHTIVRLKRLLLDRTSRPWLIGIGIVAAPVIGTLLLVGMLIGTRLLNILIGPVNVFNMTRHVKKDVDLVGEYELSEKDWGMLTGRSPAASPNSRIALNVDHSARVTNLPSYDGFGKSEGCSYNGTGQWSLYENDGVTLSIEIKVPMDIPGVLSACKSTSPALMQLLGRSAPYRFWYYVGDPDDDSGLLYTRKHS